MRFNIKDIINNYTIRTKIILGLGLVFTYFSIQSFFLLSSFSTINGSSQVLQDIREDTVEILYVDKKLLELQRDTLVYSSSGRKSVLRKMEQNIDSIKSKLEMLRMSNIHGDKAKLISSMIRILTSYSANIIELEKSYEKRDKIIRSELPTLFDQGVSELNKLLDKEKSSTSRAQINSYKKLWLEMHIDSTTFLREKKYQYKRFFNDKVKRLKESLKGRHVNFQTIFKSYHSTFENSVQVNRGYFSLVNVVMAGDSLEFSSLSEQLRKQQLDYLSNLSNENSQTIQTTLTLIKFVIMMAIPLFLIIGIFYNNTILKGLNAMTETFREFLAGDFDHDIPGIERKDEIGQLAKVGQKLKSLNKSMRLARDRAKKSESIKSEFLANMSHEIRTPMNGVLGMVGLLESTSLDDHQKDLVKTIRQSGDGLMVILNDILDISKMESGKFSLEKMDFNIIQSVNNVISLFRERLNEKDQVNLVFDYPKDMPEWIKGDAVRISQVIGNYLSNAIKFTVKGEIRIELSYRNIDSEKIELILEVSDSGIGISEEAQGRLFQKFTQADNSTTREYGGTGLGLSICANLIEVMGGSVFLKSELNKGSVFGFKVNLELGEKQVVEDDGKDIIYSDTASVYPHNILLVEDNPVNQKLAKLMLKKLGYTCDLATNGVEAIESVQNTPRPYSIVLMDMQMPVMDGLQATREIIERFDKDAPPIVALTANAFDEDRKMCHEAGMVDFIPKPIKLEFLIKVLSQDYFA